MIRQIKTQDGFLKIKTTVTYLFHQFHYGVNTMHIFIIIICNHSIITSFIVVCLFLNRMFTFYSTFIIVLSLMFSCYFNFFIIESLMLLFLFKVIFHFIVFFRHDIFRANGTQKCSIFIIFVIL